MRRLLLRNLLTSVFVVFSLISVAQKEQIVLKNSLIRLPKQEFFLQSVIDGRGNNEDIGFVMKGAFNKRVEADLFGGLEKSFGEFYTYALTKDTLKTPIIMRVVFLYISEKNNGTNETGKAEIKVEFYKVDGNRLGKVYETEAIAEETGEDVTAGHERRLRKVLETIILSFNNSDWTSVDPEYVEADRILARRSAILGNELNPEEYRWISLIMANAAFGSNAEGWGGSYMGFSTKPIRGWLVPVVVGLDRITVDPSLFVRAGFDEKANIKFNYGKVGSGAIRRLGEEFHFLFGLNVMGGPEELTRINLNDNTSTISSSFVFGGEASQSFYFISRGRVGFFLGAGLYERYLSSRVYKADIGLRIEAGVKF